MDLVRVLQGRKVSFPFAIPVNMTASITWGCLHLTQIIVQLHNWGASQF